MVTGFVALAATTLSSCLSDTRADDASQKELNNYISSKLWPMARARGISQEAFESAMSAVIATQTAQARLGASSSEYDSQAIELPQDYIRKIVTQSRLAQGRAYLRSNAETLERIEKQWGVPKELILATWGHESTFGTNQGQHDLLTTLVNRACFIPSKRAMNEQEIMAVLDLMQEGSLPDKQLSCSWAGAMGGPQFMPSSYKEYATDGNGDGVADIWNTKEDVWASIARYFHENGWNPNLPWGQEIQLPEQADFDAMYSNLTKPMSEWAALGLKKADGSALVPSDDLVTLSMPSGVNGPKFLLTENFDVILKYNKSFRYALASGYLSDRIAGAKKTTTPWPQSEYISVADVKKLQTELKRLNYYTSSVDGDLGNGTIAAIKSYQYDHRIIPDGAISLKFLKRLGFSSP
jgi:membrane-bound lytic murein transglycosylase B